MPPIDKIYLDSNLLVDFFIKCMRKTKPYEEPKIIRFLSELDALPKFISPFTVAEIAANIKSQFPEFDKQTLVAFLSTLSNTIGLKVIAMDFSLSWENVVDYTLLCKDAKDSLHVEIARNKDLWIITRDQDVPRVKMAYPKIVGESKFKRHFDV